MKPGRIHLESTKKSCEYGFKDMQSFHAGVIVNIS